MSSSSSIAATIASRRSCRAFLPDKEPDLALIRRLLVQASRAPSGGNVQPWLVHVVSGPCRRAICEAVRENVANGVVTEGTEYNVYPPNLTHPYKGYRAKLGYALYDLVGVAKTDGEGRLKQLARNWEFFDAPVGVFIVLDRQMGPPQWADCGMFMQNFMLLCQDQGLATCAQEAWAEHHLTVRRILKLKDHEMLFCGIAVGYADERAKINELRSERNEDFLTFHSAI